MRISRCKSLLRQGQGVAIAAKIFVATDLKAGRLQMLFKDERHTGYYLVIPPGVQRPALRAFVRWMRGQIDVAS